VQSNNLNPYNNNNNNNNNNLADAADLLLTQDPSHAFDYGEESCEPINSGGAWNNTTVTQQPPRPRNVSTSPPSTTIVAASEFGEDEFDFGDDDDELAALDVDTIVSQKPVAATATATSFHHLSYEDHDNNWQQQRNDRGRAPLRTMNGEHQHQHQQYGNTNNYSNDYAAGDSAPSSYGGGERGNKRSSYPPDNPSSNSNGATFGESYDNHATGRQSYGGGGASTFGESYDNNNNNFQNNGQNSHGNNGGFDNYPQDNDHGAFSKDTAGYDNFDNNGGICTIIGGNDNSNEGAPLCPGHSQPCRVLTAQTTTNAGRQFYKCSLPEGEQCDFFEWADGVEGNMYSTTAFDGAAYGGGGDTKDFYAEVRTVFGHPGFRPGQKEVIENAMNGRDCFVLMPTGGGKSLCYQLPAWCCPGISVVISPLLSLIEDQVRSMIKLGVESVFLNSTQSWEGEQQQIFDRLRNPPAHGGIKLLYVTPEKISHSGLIKGIFKTLSERGLISRFVVDEAHCLSDW